MGRKKLEKRVYEDVKRDDHYRWWVEEKKKWMSMDELATHPDCVIARTTLQQRLSRLAKKVGSLRTIWECLTTYNQGDWGKNPSVGPDRQYVAPANWHPRGFYEYLDDMNKLPVGSLSRTVR